MQTVLRLTPGIAFACVVAVVATLLGPHVPILGAPILSIVMGAAIRSVAPLPDVATPGIAYCGRYVLQGAIVLSGFALSLVTIVRTGIGTLPVTLGTVAIALVAAPIAGRALGLDRSVREMIGVGTAICGASAIAAMATVLEPSDADVALCVATIFFYNVVAVLAFPPIGHALALSQTQFGTWAGTAINDTSSVVAAGFAYGREAGAQATIVKLTRATLILPIVAAFASLRAREQHIPGMPIPWMRIVPWFIVWFLAAALADSLGAIPAAWHSGIVDAATFLVCMALAAIGLQTSLKRLFAGGSAPLALGGILWLAIAATSLLIQRFTHA